MNDFQGLYAIRDSKPEDHNFILATMLRGVYYGDSWFSLIPKDIFMTNYKQVVETLLKKRLVKVACLKEDEDVILGYSILSQDMAAIDFIFVKSAWRRKGIGKSLTPQGFRYATHLTVLGKTLLTKFPEAVFNPFAF